MFDHSKPDIQPFNERTGIVYETRIVGNTCDGLDVITESIKLPELVIGEWLYVENFGAYTVAASTDFNGFTKTQNIYILSC
jgi:diaminopimelate decarboxylase